MKRMINSTLEEKLIEDLKEPLKLLCISRSQLIENLLEFWLRLPMDSKANWCRRDKPHNLDYVDPERK